MVIWPIDMQIDPDHMFFKVSTPDADAVEDATTTDATDGTPADATTADATDGYRPKCEGAGCAMSGGTNMRYKSKKRIRRRANNLQKLNKTKKNKRKSPRMFYKKKWNKKK